MADIFDLFKKIETQQNNSGAAPVSYIIAGLGNPGDKYARTRHNMGFMCLDYISQKLGFSINKIKFKALCGEYTIDGKRILFMKPQTFMNSSGEAIAEAASFYKIPPENVIVIFDDISLNAGSMRVKRKGSDGGHNGIKSIIACLGTQNFPRIKIGVSAPPSSDEMINWVLGTIPKADWEAVYACIEKSLDAAKLIVNGEIDRAMNVYNQ